MESPVFTLCLTNIMDESSDVIYYGEGKGGMGKNRISAGTEDKCFHLKGVVSVRNR